MGHLAELGPVAASVGHLMSHDQMVLGVDCDLHVVADHARGPSAAEAEVLEVQFLDEGIHHADRVVLSNEVVEALRQQGDLRSVLSPDESLHVAPLNESPQLTRDTSSVQLVFTQSRCMAAPRTTASLARNLNPEATLHR